MDYNTIRNIDIFKGLEGSQLKEIGEKCRWNYYTADSHIIEQRTNNTDVFFIIKGCVRVVTYSIGGREIILREIKSGGHFGELEAIDELPSIAWVVALGACELAIMDQINFLNLLNSTPLISLRLLKDYTFQTRFLTERIVELSTVAANNRVHLELLRRARDNMVSEISADINPIPLHSEIANCINTTRETVSRVMNNLVRRGLVERRKDSIFINDVNSLNSLIYNNLKN